MKVAFASEDGRNINSHFGHCKAFTIYEITPEEYVWSELRNVPEYEEGDEYDKIDARVKTIGDCSLLFVTQIGSTAAAKVTRQQIMPVKVEHGTSILEQMDRLLHMLQTKPPLWLAKLIQQEKRKEDVHECE